MQITKKNNTYHLHLVIDQHGHLTVVDDRKYDWREIVDCATEIVFPVKIEVP